MKVQTIVRSAGIGSIGIGLSLFLSACGGSEDATGSESSAPTEEVVEAPQVDPLVPDLSKVVARSVERWEMVTAADWIQAYDFQDPRAKLQQPISAFLSGKEYHEYRNPSEPMIIGNEGDLAYLEMSVLWEPHHPILATVDERPEDLTQELHMVETWRWVDGEWYFVLNERQSDFLEEHPEIRDRKNKTAAASQGPSQGGADEPK